VNKAELITTLADKTGNTKKDAEVFVSEFLNIIQTALVKGDKVQLIGFGTFETRKTAAKLARNPRKPEEVIKVPAGTAPRFKPGKALKDAVNKKK
jgi:DNA-binding protein HU-beta